MLMAYSNGRCNELQDKCQQAKVSVAGLDLWVCTGIDSWQIKGLRDILSGSNLARSFSFKAQPVSCIRPSESNVSPKYKGWWSSNNDTRSHKQTTWFYEKASCVVKHLGDCKITYSSEASI